MTNEERHIIETADAVEGSWVYRKAPVRLRPWLKLARMDRPVGTWLLLWPCWWSTVMAASILFQAFDAASEEYGLDDTYYMEFDLPGFMILMLLCAIGALAMRGAGCTWNDIVDRDFDAKVDRTASRPIPAGEVTVGGAMAFLVIQCLIGLLILIALSPMAIKLGVASLFLVAWYPFMKRITWWPQAWLGLTFNWGALMGWAAVTNDLSWAPVILYLGGLFWTLGYDTIYAHQDKEDDALIGVKSSALALGQKSRPVIAIFYAIFILSLTGAGMLASLSAFYYIGLLPAVFQLFWQVRSVDFDDPDSCLNVFRSNTRFGWLVLMAILLGQVTL